MRKISAVIAVQIAAVALALRQMELGIHTDEAKYLLNIPYPHPPLARSFLSLFDGFSWQEAFVRILFATLVMQAVWIVLKIGRSLGKHDRAVLACGWLFAWGVVSQAGTVMMAPLTALQGLVLVWLYLREEDNTPQAGLIALFWLGSLFTAYQAALFFPLTVAIFRRMRLPLWQRASLFCVPVFLLCLYTLGNPFSLASMLQLSGKDAAEPLARRLGAVSLLWFMAGSGIVSIAGTAGLFVSRRAPLILTFLLVFAYVLGGYHAYYGMLFVPLFVAGLLFALRQLRWLSVFLLPVLLACSVYFMTAYFPFLDLGRPHSYRPLQPDSAARQTMDAIRMRGGTGNILIQGSFGHDWQYASRVPVLRYADYLLPGAQAVICLEDACPVRGREGWMRIDGRVEAWVRP